MNRNPSLGPSYSLLERLDAAPSGPHVFNEALETVNGILNGEISEPEIYRADEGVLAVYPVGEDRAGLRYYENDFEASDDDFFTDPVEEVDEVGVVAYPHQAVGFLKNLSRSSHKNHSLWRNVPDYN